MADLEASGAVLVACNCDYGCPCNFNAPATSGDCEGGWTWQFEKGHYGDVSLDGLALAVFADWPKAIHEGGVRLRSLSTRAGSNRATRSATTPSSGWRRSRIPSWATRCAPQSSSPPGPSSTSWCAASTVFRVEGKVAHSGMQAECAPFSYASA